MRIHWKTGFQLVLEVIIIFGVAMCAKAAQPQSNDSLARSLDWRLLIGALDYHQLTDDAQMASTNLMGKFDDQLTSSLKTHIELGATFDAGHTQTLSGDLTPHNTIYLVEASATWQPLRFLDISGGALDQNRRQPETEDVDLVDGTPMLFEGQTFPAIREIAHTESQRFLGSLSLEQAVPTSSTLSTEATAEEPMPRYASETVRGDYHLTSGLKLVGWVKHFSFFNLPSEIAEKSRFGGNDVTGFSNAVFEYPFQGIAASLSGALAVNRALTLTLGFQGIKNFWAPEDLANGQLVFLTGRYMANDDLAIQPLVEYWRLEADASPAAYNSFPDGHNNRVGGAIQLDLHFLRYHFAVGFRLIQTHPLAINPQQGDSQYYILRLETDYASI